MNKLEFLFLCCFILSTRCTWVFQADSIHDPPLTHGKESVDELRVVYEDIRSPCHSEGRASQCMPPFTNIAEGVAPKATSTCGATDRSEKFCKPQMDNTGHTRMQCEQCNNPEKFSARYLTDRHQMVNETLWVSGAIHQGQTVNITLSLGKTFEVYYVSLQPFGVLPDAIAIYKSADFGKTWQPWQYFSNDCFRAFRLPTSNEHNAQISAANIQEVLCVALKSSDNHNVYGQTVKVIAFSTTIGRPSSQPWSSALVDWMTMTDIRISLTRFGHLSDMAQHDASRLLLTPNLLSAANIFRVGDAERAKMSTGTLGMSRNQFQSDAASIAQEKGIHFAFSDLAIGGRCKCNGHSNRCVRDRLLDTKGKQTEEWGPLRCDCQHNTAGTDCDRCAPGYLDRPWARATRELANECKLCDCNLHSASCEFSQQIYLMSSKTSGGICQDCQHNTVGRRCHLCANGYYRDWTKPVSHDQVCLECRCHPIGSIPNEPCDRKSGQCPCKPGVIGQACNRCEDGYKQTRLSDRPCIRVVEHFAYRRKAASPPVPDTVNQPVNMEPHPQCPPCKPHRKRIRFKRFCRKPAVFMGRVESSRKEGDKIRLEIRIRDTWRVGGGAEHLLPKKASPNLPPFPVWIQSHSAGSENKNPPIRCFCPELKTGQSYLFLTQPYQISYGNRMELMLDPNSTIIPWRESWRRRLEKFVRRAAKNRCNAMAKKQNDRNSQRPRRAQKLQPPAGYFVNRLATDGPLRYAQPRAPVHTLTYTNGAPQGTASHPAYQMYADHPVKRNPSPRNNQPQFSYYNPYSRYPHQTK